MDLTAVSLFAGIGGFDLALAQVGVNVVAAIEIDAAARGVLHDRFPGEKLFEDVREVTAQQLIEAGFNPENGIITAGWPCQGNSVAGRRGGMDDPRSGLWSEVKRLLRETGAAYFIGENVPGLLSVNGGDDMAQVLDDLNELGYLVDIDILDAQHFGVPQRRRRVVFTCQKLSHSLQRKTTTSALTLAQCLIETSLLSLVVLSQGSAKGSAPWDSPERCVDGLRKRIELFGMRQPLENICETWLPVLAGDSVRQALAPSTSDSPRGDSTDDGPTPSAATSSPDSTEPPAVTSLSTASSWRQLLEDLLPTARSCITSTPSRPTTSSEISTCARALLSISEYIAALTNSSPDCWQPASSASTAIEVFTNYARATDGNLLAFLDGLHDLVDLLEPAERADVALRRARDRAAPVEVLLEPEGGGGDPAPGRASGPGASVVTALRAGSGGGCGPDDNDAQGGRLIAGTLGSRVGGSRTTDLDGHGAYVPVSIAPALTARYGKGTDSDATDGLVPVAFDAAQITSAENRVNPRPGDPSMPLAATGNPMVYQCQGSNVGPVGTLRKGDGGVTSGVPFVAQPDTTYVPLGGEGVAHALTAEGHDASEDGTGRGTPLVPVEAIAFDWQTDGSDRARPNISQARTSSLQTEKRDAVATATAVRRLTPTECERLQGFPDGWTATSWAKPQADSPRYRQLGNSVAVPVFAWVARRLARVHSQADTGSAA